MENFLETLSRADKFISATVKDDVGMVLTLLRADSSPIPPAKQALQALEELVKNKAEPLVRIILTINDISFGSRKSKVI